jgi:DNA-binding transcriptional regulator GbsR (MarR family)
MKLLEAKKQFVEAWGTFGTQWGINRTMAQIHALLLVSDDLLTTDQIMEELQISRGNANMNIRALIDWELVERRHKRGERVEFFEAEKDIWKVAVKIIRERRKKEIDPMRKTIKGLQDIEDKNQHKDSSKAFLTLLKDIEDFAGAADKITDKLVLSDKGWFFISLMKMMS